MKNEKKYIKQFKKISVMTMCLFTIAIFSSCSSNTLVGEWYNTDDLEDVLILTEDETFSTNDIGGTYTKQDEKLMLTASYGESEIMEISSIDSYDCLIEDNGDIWIKGYENAAAYHDKMVEEEINTLEKQCAGKYERTNDIYIILNADYTYEYSTIYPSKSGYSGWQKAGQTGTWETYIENEELYLKLNPENSWQEEENDYRNPWVKTNEPVFEGATFYLDEDDNRIRLYYGSDFWDKVN